MVLILGLWKHHSIVAAVDDELGARIKSMAPGDTITLTEADLLLMERQPSDDVRPPFPCCITWTRDGAMEFERTPGELPLPK